MHVHAARPVARSDARPGASSMSATNDTGVHSRCATAELHGRDYFHDEGTMAVRSIAKRGLASLFLLLVLTSAAVLGSRVLAAPKKDSGLRPAASFNSVADK